jgi:hypothetical protein
VAFFLLTLRNRDDIRHIVKMAVLGTSSADSTDNISSLRSSGVKLTVIRPALHLYETKPSPWVRHAAEGISAKGEFRFYQGKGPGARTGHTYL